VISSLILTPEPLGNFKLQGGGSDSFTLFLSASEIIFSGCRNFLSVHPEEHFGSQE